MANILASETYWLMRPNDDNRLEEGNVAVAKEQVTTLGERMSALLQQEALMKK